MQTRRQRSRASREFEWLCAARNETTSATNVATQNEETNQQALDGNDEECTVEEQVSADDRIARTRDIGNSAVNVGVFDKTIVAVQAPRACGQRRDCSTAPNANASQLAHDERPPAHHNSHTTNLAPNRSQARRRPAGDRRSRFGMQQRSCRAAESLLQSNSPPRACDAKTNQHKTPISVGVQHNGLPRKRNEKSNLRAAVLRHRMGRKRQQHESDHCEWFCSLCFVSRMKL